MTTAKAIVGAVVTGLSTVLTALTTGDQHLSVAEVVAALIAALVAYGAVWRTENADEPTTSDSGESFVGFLYIVALICVIAACLTYVLPKIVG